MLTPADALKELDAALIDARSKVESLRSVVGMLVATGEPPAPSSRTVGVAVVGLLAELDAAAEDKRGHFKRFPHGYKYDANNVPTDPAAQADWHRVLRRHEDAVAALERYALMTRPRCEARAE